MEGETKTSPSVSVSESHREAGAKWSSSYALILSIIAPILAATLLYRVDPIHPAHLPLTFREAPPVPLVNPRVLQGSEFVGSGRLVGPEDIVFDPSGRFVYTGCADGWVKRFALGNESAIEDWVNTGGRPLGLALGLVQGELIVADAFKGLLRVSAQGKVELLTDEVEGRKLKFADGVDVAKDGMIYFSEASSKYGFPEFIWDVFEGKPYGSLMSFDPVTRETRVLARDLYFANGVHVSTDQKSVIFCETVLARCRKYIIKGEKKGTMEMFVDNLPGFPDNIKYDGEGHYWIALSTSRKPYWEVAMKYPPIRKALAIVTRYVGRPHMERNAGLLAVDEQGKPVAHYYDRGLALISGGAKIGDHLYFGSIVYPHIIRLDLARHAAT